MSDEEITDEVETVEYQLDEEGNPILDEEGSPIPVPQGFQPYEVTVGEAIYTVLEPSEPDTHRVRTPEGVVTAIPCTDSAEDTLTAEQVQDWLDNPPAPPVAVRKIPKLVIRRRIRELGKEVVFDATLDAVPNARADWTDSSEISTDDPLFTEQRAAFQAAMGLTDDQLDYVLSPE